MLLFNVDVFQEMIVGTTGTWYSYAQFNDILGQAERLAVLAHTTNVGGTTPKLNIFADDSLDGKNWVLGTSSLYTATLTNGLVQFAQKVGGIGTFGRLRIQLTGTTPQCRLKLTATGRS